MNRAKIFVLLDKAGAILSQQTADPSAFQAIGVMHDKRRLMFNGVERPMPRPVTTYVNRAALFFRLPEKTVAVTIEARDDYGRPVFAGPLKEPIDAGKDVWARFMPGTLSVQVES